MLAFPGVATAASHTPFTDVPASFWAGSQIRWTVKQRLDEPPHRHELRLGHTVSRLTAARVLADVNFQQTGTPVAADPYAQAVAAGWIGPGTGADSRSRSCSSTTASCACWISRRPQRR